MSQTNNEEYNLISVIVPVYNVEAYLDRCVESLVNQTYKNLEILLVDDGSTDSSGALCDRWALRDTRIRVIHKPNGGLSDARNTGLRAAAGELLLFIDSDDLVNVHMAEYLLNELLRQDADISICTFQDFADGQDVDVQQSVSCEDVLVQPGRETILDIYRGKGEKTAFVAWNKLYRRKLFTEHRIEYPVGRIHEDTFTTYQLLYFADKVAVLRAPMYYYRLRGGSIMHVGISVKKCTDSVDAGCSELAFYAEHQDRELLSRAYVYHCRRAMAQYAMVGQMADSREKAACRRYIRDRYRMLLKEYGNQVSISFAKKTAIRLFRYIPGLMSRLG